MTVKVPSKVTLKKYGLSESEWLQILANQGGVCAVCKRVPESGRLHTEHEHVPRYKHLPPEQRKLYIRGICCFICNTQFLGRGISVEKAKNVVTYLEQYQARRGVTLFPN